MSSFFQILIAQLNDDIHNKCPSCKPSKQAVDQRVDGKRQKHDDEDDEQDLLEVGLFHAQVEGNLVFYSLHTPHIHKNK